MPLKCHMYTWFASVCIYEAVGAYLLYICKVMCIYAFKISYAHLVCLCLHIWGRRCISAVYMQSNVHIWLKGVIRISSWPRSVCMRPFSLYTQSNVHICLQVSFIHLVGLCLYTWGRWCISAVYMQSNLHICLNNVICTPGWPLFAYIRPLVHICRIYAKQCAYML